MPPLFGTRFMRHVGYPTFLTLKSWARHADLWPMKRLRQFIQLGRSEPEVWRAFRDDRLRELLGHALREVPFYADLPRDLADLIHDDPMAALREFPVVTKRDMQERSDDLLARDMSTRHMRRAFTGGSTGERVRFWLDHRRDMLRDLGAHRMEMNAGWRLGEPIGLIWADSRQFVWASHRSLRTLKNLSRMHPVLSHYQLTPDVMRAFLKTLERVRPSFLRGYASSTHEFARFLEEDGLLDRARGLGLRGIMTSCDTLQPHQHERIEHVFGTRIFSLYASHEAQMIALECPAHNGLHINADNVVLEILGEDGCPVPDGEFGQPAVTDLWNLGYAIIRVNLMDVARRMPEETPCPCGMTFPRLADLEGRVGDLLTLPNGDHIHGNVYIAKFAKLPSVRFIQIEQEARDHVTIRLVADPAQIDPLLPGILTGVLPGVNVDVQYVDNIPRSPAGKHLWVISHVKP